MSTNSKRIAFLLLLTAAACPATAQIVNHAEPGSNTTVAHNEQGRKTNAAPPILAMPPLHLSTADRPQSPLPNSLTSLLLPDPPVTLPTPSFQIWPAAPTFQSPLGSRLTSVATTPAVPAPSAVSLLVLAAAVGFPRRRR